MPSEQELEREIWRLKQAVDCRENKLRIAAMELTLKQQLIEQLKQELADLKAGKA